MNKLALRFGLLASCLPLLCGCVLNEDQLKPKGIDTSVYENSTYVTAQGTTYKATTDNILASLHGSYRFAPTGVVHSESRLGKIAFSEVPYGAYYFDSDTEIRIVIGNTQMHGHFYTDENNKRCFVFENYLQVTFAEV